MALKLPDSAVPMGDFPVAKAVDIDFDDGENLQEKLDNGTLGGASSEEQIKDWVSGETYEIGDYVYYDEKLYRCTTENSDVDFSEINWKNLSGGGSGSGIASDVAYDNVALTDVDNVAEALDMIVSKIYYVAPKITSFTASPTGGVFEIGTTISAPTFNWNYNKDITTQTLTDCTLADETIRTATYDSNIISDKTFTLVANDGETSVTKSISYRFVNPYYTGVLDIDAPTEANITSLTKKVELQGPKTITYTTSQSYMIFAYPVIYHAISSIIDQNGFNVTDSFTQNTLTINSVGYYVYVSNRCSGAYTMKFNY